MLALMSQLIVWGRLRSETGTISKMFFWKKGFTILSSGRLSAVMLEKIGTSLSPRISRNSTKRPSCGWSITKKNNAGGRYPNCTGALNFKSDSLRKSSLNLKIKRRGLNWKGQNPPCGQKVTPQKSIIRRVHNYSMIITKTATVQNNLWGVVWWW